MKRKFTVILMTLLTAFVFMAMPAAADDQELTDLSQSGKTEVDANITDGAGEVAYIVSIPQKIDFGTLVCPDSNEDSPAVQKFQVKCVKMQGVRKITVNVCNEGSVKGEENQGFYLINMTNASCDFRPSYDLYVGNTVEDATKVSTSGAMPANGYDYVAFSAEGQSVGSGVALNQKQLYPYKDKLSQIAGSYSGRMVFTISAI